MNIDYILIPQGQEYQRVKRGFQLANKPLDRLLPIPMTPRGVTLFLAQWLPLTQFTHQRLLLMGLGGSLSPQYAIGDLTVYHSCYYQNSHKNCDRELNLYLQQNLNLPTFLVQGLTSDRLINLAQEKSKIFTETQAEVIDMEAFILLEKLAEIGVKLSILRVISDDAHGDLPDLNSAFTHEGTLKPLSLTLQLIREPLNSLRLIRGSLKALTQLEKIAFKLANLGL